MTGSETLDHLLSPEQRKQDEIAARRARSIQVMLVVVLVIIIGTWIWGIFWSYSQPKINEVGISNAQVVGESALCAGDKLILSYEFHASGAGKLVEGATVWRDTPPKTIVYSEERSFLIDGTFDEPVTLAWAVPIVYINPATGNDEPLVPGDYRRIFSVSSVSRPSVFAIASVDFSIRSDCQEGRE